MNASSAGPSGHDRQMVEMETTERAREKRTTAFWQRDGLKQRVALPDRFWRRRGPHMKVVWEYKGTVWLLRSSFGK